MVQAILDGRKTMTRRVVKPQPAQGAYHHHDEDDGVAFANPCSFHKYRYCIGDRLWVRETWYSTPDKKELLGYVADSDIPHNQPYRIRPSIFLPRWASRITLEITGVRVERGNECFYFCKRGYIHKDLIQPWKVCKEWKFDKADAGKREW